MVLALTCLGEGILGGISVLMGLRQPLESCHHQCFKALCGSFVVSQRFSFGASGWFFEAPTLYYFFFYHAFSPHRLHLGLVMGVVKGSLLHLVISRMQVVTRVKKSGLHRSFWFQCIQRRGDGKDCAPLLPKERGVRRVYLAILFLALGLGDCLHWGRLEAGGISVSLATTTSKTRGGCRSPFLSSFVLCDSCRVPLSWRKTAGGDTVAWVGFELLHRSSQGGITLRRAEWFIRWSKMSQLQSSSVRRGCVGVRPSPPRTALPFQDLAPTRLNTHSPTVRLVHPQEPCSSALPVSAPLVRCTGFSLRPHRLVKMLRQAVNAQRCGRMVLCDKRSSGVDVSRSQFGAAHRTRVVIQTTWTDNGEIWSRIEQAHHDATPSLSSTCEAIYIRAQIYLRCDPMTMHSRFSGTSTSTICSTVRLHGWTMRGAVE